VFLSSAFGSGLVGGAEMVEELPAGGVSHPAQGVGVVVGAAAAAERDIDSAGDAQLVEALLEDGADDAAVRVGHRGVGLEDLGERDDRGPQRGRQRVEVAGVGDDVADTEPLTQRPAQRPGREPPVEPGPVDGQQVPRTDCWR